HHIGLPPPSRQQRHFPEELAGAEPHAACRQSHLDGTGRNKKDGVPPVPSADNALVRHGEARPQQPGYTLQLALVEAGVDVKPLDQAMRIQTDFKARSRLDAVTQYSALKIFIKFLWYQPLLEQRLVSAFLLPQRRLAQEPDLQRCYIVGVLPIKRVQCVAD